MSERCAVIGIGQTVAKAKREDVSIAGLVREAALMALEKGSAQAPHQWQHWFYVDVAGMLIFIPVIWLTGGRWKPSSARRDAEEHEAAVAEELARLIGQQTVRA